MATTMRKWPNARECRPLQFRASQQTHYISVETQRRVLEVVGR